MNAAVVYAPGDMRIEERPHPVPRAGEVLVRIAKVGICGSDVHYYFEGGLGVHKVKQPIILGHECAGEVVGAGPGVERLALGDRVVIEPGVPCGQCEFCRQGKYNDCQSMHFMATPPVDGAFCEYVAWPEAYCYRMPDSMTFAEGAMIEPLAVAVYSVDLADIAIGQSVAILGSAAIGLFTLQCARLAGAGKIIVTDLMPERLEAAQRFGADVVIDASEGNVPERVLAETDGLGADVVLEAAGSLHTMAQSVHTVKPGGTVVIIGICPEDVIPIDFGAARRREVTYKFVRRYRHAFDRGVGLVAAGRVDARSMVTHNYPFAEITDAFDLVKDCRDHVLKATVQVDPDAE